MIWSGPCVRLYRCIQGCSLSVSRVCHPLGTTMPVVFNGPGRRQCVPPDHEGLSGTAGRCFRAFSGANRCYGTTAGRTCRFCSLSGYARYWHIVTQSHALVFQPLIYDAIRVELVLVGSQL
ncbi:hypothetical protein PBRA_005260 [Plasmodiophora brassicae]|uniref:Uncharacterized protein n=1 Tax=Plasmodiophora brassicae TaxID=37360 RepID=A0A0G4IN49_PLABS|nr:hypothetical protein PBRA_005260 [Plasmodiophora brassicae]